MSLISDALNKVQLQQQTAGTAFSSYSNHSHHRRHQPVVRVKSLTFIWANAAILTVFFIGGLVYLRNRPYPAEAPTNQKITPTQTVQQPAADQTVATTAVTSPQAVSKPFPTATESTETSFSPAAYNPPSAPAVSAEYDLAGMSALGNSTLLSVSRRSDHRSFWIQVGKSVGEITAVSYDPETDSAKISVNGRLQTIKMRDGAAAIAAE